MTAGKSAASDPDGASGGGNPAYPFRFAGTENRDGNICRRTGKDGEDLSAFSSVTAERMRCNACPDEPEIYDGRIRKCMQYFTEKLYASGNHNGCYCWIYGETEEEFAQTKEYLKRIHFYEMHIFKYSRRQGTRAAVMEHQVPEEIKTKRSAQLLALAESMSRNSARIMWEKRKKYSLRNQWKLTEKRGILDIPKSM